MQDLSQAPGEPVPPGPPQPGSWQAPNGEWFPAASPPFVPDPPGSVPQGSPGPHFWQAPDGQWYSPKEPPYLPAGSLGVGDSLSKLIAGANKVAEDHARDGQARQAATSAAQGMHAVSPPVQVAQDDEGRGTFGDGQQTPLYELKASRVKGGRLFTPNVIRVWPNRVEEYEHHAVRKKGTEAINFTQVSQVNTARGLVWTDISIESTGGKSIKIAGIPKEEADRVKEIIDNAVQAATHQVVAVHHSLPETVNAAPSVAVQKDITVQLRELASMRNEGILTEGEFLALKAKLLDN